MARHQRKERCDFLICPPGVGFRFERLGGGGRAAGGFRR
jgi:hypothetical protein